MSRYRTAIVGDQQLPGFEPYDPPSEQGRLFQPLELPAAPKAWTLTIGEQERIPEDWHDGMNWPW